MAKIENIKLKIQTIKIKDQEVDFVQSKYITDHSLPQIYWFDSSPWDEVNLYAYDLLINENLNIKTVKANIFHLHAYATWLEENNVDWLDFPDIKSERCLVIFRGYLIKKRDALELAPTTTTQRMRAVIKFYRWVKEKKVINTEFQMWKNKIDKKKIINKFGFESTIDTILNVAKNKSSLELYLILKVGFYTGMRIGTISDLKVETLENSILFKNKTMSTIRVGPNASPAVSTKYSKDGNILIPTDLVHELIEYCYSIRRLKRVARAENSNSNLIFLTRSGNRYLDIDNKSINVAMHRLRCEGIKLGYNTFKSFHFHQTRATFATVLMEYCLTKMSPMSAMQLVKDACMHKDEQVTFKYIKFLENSKSLEKISNQYTNIFLGIENA